MHSSGINGEGELRGQPANSGSPEKMAVKTECVCVCVCVYPYHDHHHHQQCYVWLLLLLLPSKHPNNSLSILTTIFPDEPGLASFIAAKDNGGGGDYWSYKTCNGAVKSSPPTNHHPVFYRPDALRVAQPTVSEHRRE